VCDWSAQEIDFVDWVFNSAAVLRERANLMEQHEGLTDDLSKAMVKKSSQPLWGCDVALGTCGIYLPPNDHFQRVASQHHAVDRLKYLTVTMYLDFDGRGRGSWPAARPAGLGPGSDG
jgi:hypothetical protein